MDKTQLEKDKNVIIGVVERPPNGDIDLFNTYMSELLSKIKSERKYFSCVGDYNISLLNYDTHGPTQEFADLMYSHIFFVIAIWMIILAFCTQTYQTTFKFIILIAHVRRKQLVHTSKIFHQCWAGFGKWNPPNSQSPRGFMIRNINRMAVLPVSQSEVSDIINNFTNSSPGWDSISANVVKGTYPHFIEHLTHIMNLSITQGIFPKQLKLAKVIPLLKSGDPITFSAIIFQDTRESGVHKTTIIYQSTNTYYYTLFSLHVVGGIFLISLWFAW